MNHNPLLMTDVYKLNHMRMYCPGTTKVWSYLMARSDKEFNEVVFFGLKYYLMEYLAKPITTDHMIEFFHYHNKILGPTSPDVEKKILALVQLGYWPLEIKAVPETRAYPVKNILMSITNTHPDFYWCVGFVESLLLKIWFPCTVATHSRKYRELAKQFFYETGNQGVEFAVHDFGYRGDTSEEAAALAGGAHLLNFKGSDSIVAYPFMDTYYPELEAEMFSVPATEHSVMCSYGKDGELEAFKRMLEIYPEGLISIVSDTYNLWTVLTDYMKELYSAIVNRKGKVVIRPDSGDPEKILCGDPDAEYGTPEYYGIFRLLEAQFGSTLNGKGYKELPGCIGVIYGDGMYLERYVSILTRMKLQGWASSNLVIGVGSLLRRHTRDTLGFAIKATYVEVDGIPREIMKDPITDHGKKSHQGLLQLKMLTELINPEQGISGTHSARCTGYETIEHCTWEQEASGVLTTVFKDGKVICHDKK